MAIKYTALGLLIYLAMAGHLAAFVLRAARLARAAWVVYAAGFGVSLAALVHRSISAGHFPLSNLFEVFLFMGAVMFPLSVFCRRALRVGIEGGDMLLGACVLLPAGFVFEAGAKPLMPALQSNLFIPHVATYMVSYVILAKAAVQAGSHLILGDRPPGQGLVSTERATWRVICLGFPLITTGLILGAWWGKRAWGDWWNWDPKEMWGLASWLAYVLYLHHRRTFGRRRGKLNVALALLGIAMIVITLLWVNLSRIFKGIHSYA